MARKPKKPTRIVTTIAMIVARLHISYDRGTKRNNAPDLGLDSIPEKTSDGTGLVRGLGSHYRSAEARSEAQRLAKEETRIRTEFRRSFMAAPMDGYYILPEADAGRQLLDTLDVDPGVTVGCSEWVIETSGEERPPEELIEWSEKVKRQIADVPLGRSKAPDADGLKLLSRLAACPVLDESTRTEIMALIADAKLEAITRVELKRELKILDVKVGIPTAPRRTPVVAAVPDALAGLGTATKPRRGPGIASKPEVAEAAPADAGAA